MHARTVAPSIRPVRAVLLVLAMLAALLAAALPTAGVARAAVPDRWGFAFLDNPTPPAGYVPDLTRQWGSWPSPAANPVKVDQLGVGKYLVHFPLIAGPGGIAHVTAVGRTGDWCQLKGWSTAGTGQDVAVNCYRLGGAPVNSLFTVLYTTSSGVPSPAGGSYGYTYSAVSGAVLAQYNSAGAVNTVSHGSTGIWKAWLPGLGLSTQAGNIEVTAMDPFQGAHCKVADWVPGATGQTIVVTCFNAANVPYDTQWTLSYSLKRAVHGPAFPPKSFGYLWFNGGVPAATNFNSSGAVNTLAGASPYTVTLPGVAVVPDTAHATAYGSGPGWCGLTTPWTRSAGTVKLSTICFNTAGSPVAAPFLTAYSSAF